jgi:hypothetical protein
MLIFNHHTRRRICRLVRATLVRRAGHACALTLKAPIGVWFLVLDKDVDAGRADLVQSELRNVPWIGLELTSLDALDDVSQHIVGAAR